jgi:hypothetical protein
LKGKFIWAGKSLVLKTGANRYVFPGS